MADGVSTIAAGVVSVELDGRACVFAPSTQQVLLLDDAGSLVWRLLKDGTAPAALAQGAAAATGSPVELVAPDVEALLSQLREAGAVVGR